VRSRLSSRANPSTCLTKLAPRLALTSSSVSNCWPDPKCFLQQFSDHQNRSQYIVQVGAMPLARCRCSPVAVRGEIASSCFFLCDVRVDGENDFGSLFIAHQSPAAWGDDFPGSLVTLCNSPALLENGLWASSNWGEASWYKTHWDCYRRHQKHSSVQVFSAFVPE